MKLSTVLALVAASIPLAMAKAPSQDHWYIYDDPGHTYMRDCWSSPDYRGLWLGPAARCLPSGYCPEMGYGAFYQTCEQIGSLTPPNDN
ncbi:uncharacterized protein PSFLO_02808 [Pseudozyma flocculosa]|uniref:Uncharacterized protein n=1 Tax=Pseudozyma flocculosa TaxID=84751 RepID=A0A5C3EZU2_9BASI|nr:uncharacterized protein PSFLO_02808 [Pseudozyma flocculosa]